MQKAAHLKRAYGITLEYFNELLGSQNGECAICLTDNPQGAEQMRWNVDHDHKTGKIRGILCGVCNRTIGIAKESIFRLEKSIEYLKKHAAAT